MSAETGREQGEEEAEAAERQRQVLQQIIETGGEQAPAETKAPDRAIRGPGPLPSVNPAVAHPPGAKLLKV